MGRRRGYVDDVGMQYRGSASTDPLVGGASVAWQTVGRTLVGSGHVA